MNLSAREEDKDRIVGSLETILQALLGPTLETLRLSVSDLAAETERRIDGLREETQGSLEALRADMLSATEDAKREALAAIENGTSSMAEHAGSRLETARSELNQKLDEAESRLQKAHLSLSERLDTAEHGLIEHQTASGRMAEVLDTLGHVLSREKAPRESATFAPPPEPVSEPLPDNDEMLTELEITLNEPAPQSMIDTQPLPVQGDDSTNDTDEMEGALDRVALTASVPSTSRDPE